MRVLIAAPWFRTIAEIHHAALKDMGHEVRTVTTNAQLGRVTEELGAEITILDSHIRGQVLNRRTLGALWSIRNWRPDAAILDTTWDIRFTAMASCAKRIYTAIHDPRPHDSSHARSGWKRAAESYSRRISSHNLYFSEHGRSIDGSPRPSSVLALPSEVKDKTVSDVPEGQRTGVLFLGRQSDYKGFDVLLNAWEKIDPLVRASNPLAVLTSGDCRLATRRSDIQVRAGTYSDADAVRAVSSAKVLVLPYRAASQSGVQILGQQFGTPSVVTDVGALPEMQPFRHPVVPVDDPTSLAAEITRILHADDWEALSRQAKACYEQNHSSTAVAAGLRLALEES